MVNRHVLAFLATAILLAAMPASYGDSATTLSKQQLVYGSGISANALANAELFNNISFRFKAEHSGVMDKIVFYLVFAPGGSYPYYFQGDGGNVLAELRADDGTAYPSETVLGSWLIGHPMDPTNHDYNGHFIVGNSNEPRGSFPIISLDRPVQLEQGKIYHIVFSNPAMDPDHNFVSINTLINCDYFFENNLIKCKSGQARSSMQPRFSDEELAVLSKARDGQWRIEEALTPIYALYFTDGNSQGQGYMEVEITNETVAISGSNIVKETFTVSGGNKTVTDVPIRIWKKELKPPTDLTVKLEEAGGTTVEEGTVPTSAIQFRTEIEEKKWVIYRFSKPRTLESGKTYNLVLSAPAGSPYYIYPIYEGPSYGFPYGLNGGAGFRDGWALYSNDSGASWCGFQYSGGCGSLFDTSRDFQFYFTAELCGDAKCNSEIGETCSNCPTDCGACCGNGTCEAGETFESCPADCPQIEECVDTLTLMNQYIPQWKRGEISMLTLMQKMKQWKTGTGC